MSWNYSGNPADSDKDAVRFWTGDKDPRDQLVQDEEILYVLSLQPDIILAAADILDELAIKFSRYVDSRVGDVQESASKRADAFKKRADELRAGKSAGTVGVEWFFGGQSKQGKIDLESDEDAVRPTFTEGQDDNPRHRQADEDLDWRCRR